MKNSIGWRGLGTFFTASYFINKFALKDEADANVDLVILFICYACSAIIDEIEKDRR